MATKINLQSQKGFTIVEVLVTIFLIVTSLMLYQATTKAVLFNRTAKYKEVALRIADKKLQSIRATAFASIPASGTFSDSLLNDIPDGAGTITVTALNLYTKDVKVKVSWTNPQTRTTQDIELETYISQWGLGQ